MTRAGRARAPPALPADRPARRPRVSKATRQERREARAGSRAGGPRVPPRAGRAPGAGGAGAAGSRYVRGAPGTGGREAAPGWAVPCPGAGSGSVPCPSLGTVPCSGAGSGSVPCPIVAVRGAGTPLPEPPHAPPPPGSGRAARRAPRAAVAGAALPGEPLRAAADKVWRRAPPPANLPGVGPGARGRCAAGRPARGPSPSRGSAEPRPGRGRCEGRSASGAGPRPRCRSWGGVNPQGRGLRGALRAGGASRTAAPGTARRRLRTGPAGQLLVCGSRIRAAPVMPERESCFYCLCVQTHPTVVHQQRLHARVLCMCKVLHRFLETSCPGAASLLAPTRKGIVVSFLESKSI